jgi:hypothetical protein
MAIETIIFSIISITLYAVLVWFSVKRAEDQYSVYKYLVSSSVVTLIILVFVISISMFWSILACILMLVIASYLGSQHAGVGRLIKDGVFGGFWLVIPWYLHLLSYT